MNAIFAVNKHGGFGRGRTMPWPRNSLDLRRFREITNGHTVVMGRETWNSDMPTPLSNRRNCILSTSMTACDGAEVYTNITDLLMNLNQQEQVFVIGGARTLWNLRSYITRIFVTIFDSEDASDSFLDLNLFLNGFSLITREKMDNHVFDTLTRL